MKVKEHSLELAFKSNVGRIRLVEKELRANELF